MTPLLIALSGLALAQDKYVDLNAGPTPPPDTYVTLQAAVQAATNGVNIWIAPGDYTGQGVVGLSRDVQLIGTGPGVLLPAVEVLTGGVYGFPTATLQTVTLWCGPDVLSPSVYKAPNAWLIVDDVTSNCGDSANRTVILAEGAHSLTVRNSLFLGSGNHIITDGSPLIVENTGFSGLLEDARGILYRNTVGAAVPDISITGSTFTAYDKSANNGGAVYINAPLNSLTLTDDTFLDNLAASGGAVYVRSTPSVVVADSTFDSNANGALVLIDSSASVTTSSFSNTTGDAIHGISTVGNGVDIASCTFRDNLGRGFVSEIAQASTVHTSHFCGNAGDIRWVTGDLAIEGSTFALGAEGADSIDGASTATGTLTLLNTTFAGFDGSAIDVGAAAGYTVDVRETIFHDLATEAVYGGGTPLMGTGLYNNLYLAPAWAGGGFVAGNFDPSSTSVDPGFQGYIDRLNTTCDTLNLWIDPNSPLRDLGAGTDLDGTASDIGGYGGLYADLIDGDGDNVFQDRDCNDADPTIYPGATDIAHDGVDQDCNGADNLDGDGDGYDADFAGGTDCDDNDASIHPGAVEIGSDGIDQDCDGYDLTDVDGDGFDSQSSGGDDCDDLDATVNPTATEIWYDGVDQDCDGRSDYDQDDDGYDSADYQGDDCDDLDSSVNPGATDVPDNGIDEDCSGADETSGTGTGTGGGTATGGTGTGGPSDGPKDEPKTCNATGSPVAGGSLFLGLLLALGRRRERVSRS